MTLRIVAFAREREHYEDLLRDSRFGAVDDHPFTNAFGRQYYPLTVGDQRRNCSFAVIDGEQPVALLMGSTGEGVLDWYGMPARLFFADGHASASDTVGALFAEVERLLEIERIETALVHEPVAASTLSSLGLACNARGWQGELAFNAVVGLANGEPELRATLRKSFRSLVNWGSRNMRLVHVNRDNPDARAIQAYREFHLRIAGRSTRPEESWLAMRDAIFSGGGELTLGYLESGALVAGTMVIDGAKIAYYSSGVYDREQFDKPMAHYPLYQAILRAGDRGKKTFDLGEIPQPGTKSAKEMAIGYFKRGFASNVACAIVWHWHRRESVPARDGPGVR